MGITGPLLRTAVGTLEIVFAKGILLLLLLPLLVQFVLVFCRLAQLTEAFIGEIDDH